VLSLKKVARLPSKDRNEILKILKKKVLKRSGRKGDQHGVEVVNQGFSGEDSSSASVINDWKN